MCCRGGPSSLLVSVPPRERSRRHSYTSLQTSSRQPSKMCKTLPKSAIHRLHLTVQTVIRTAVHGKKQVAVSFNFTCPLLSFQQTPSKTRPPTCVFARAFQRPAHLHHCILGRSGVAYTGSFFGEKQTKRECIFKKVQWQVAYVCEMPDSVHIQHTGVWIFKTPLPIFSQNAYLACINR